MKIERIDAWQIFDSRGHPTLEAEITLDGGTTGRASVPAGASRGKTEAVELRDGNPNRFSGLTVDRAIRNVKDRISPALKGMEADNQQDIDQRMIELDGTANKSSLGANSILSVSMAVARAVSNARNRPLYECLGSGHGTLLPVPEIQILGGGAHSRGRIDIQDFMVICPGAESYLECLEMTFHIYRACGELLDSRNLLAGVADEGGYWPLFKRNEEGLEILTMAIEKAGYRPGQQVGIALDIAASEFRAGDGYRLELESRELTQGEWYRILSDWCRQYPILSVEDPFHEEDIVHWQKLVTEFGGELQIVGDDLFTTDIQRVRDGHERALANSVLIKLNQIGTVTETLACIRQTQDYGWTPIVSARSGETEDPFIAHLAVATESGQFKVGSFSRTERMVKWNELIRIGRHLGDRARFTPFRNSGVQVR